MTAIDLTNTAEIRLAKHKFPRTTLIVLFIKDSFSRMEITTVKFKIIPEKYGKVFEVFEKLKLTLEYENPKQIFQSRFLYFTQEVLHVPQCVKLVIFRTF